jgi:hypothetical protein
MSNNRTRWELQNNRTEMLDSPNLVPGFGIKGETGHQKARGGRSSHIALPASETIEAFSCK